MQPGDVEATAAETRALEAWVGFRPAKPLAEGVGRFAAWYGRSLGGDSSCPRLVHRSAAAAPAKLVM